MPHRDREPFKGRIGKTYQDSLPSWPERPQAAAGAPNVILIVLDDVGFSDIGCYGSEIHTPNIDALAAGGLLYNNFHVTSMCSPTRACLMTGRNSHSVGVGIISEWSNGFPAYQGRITRKAATLPEILNEHSYSSYASGKWHLTNLADYGAAGPHGDWPLGRGFARWYGFHGALTDQWNPELYEDNHPFHREQTPGYHLSTDLVDRAISHIRDHVTSAPTRPFFEYLAFGACHWPHHVPKAYIDKYRGRYDKGWDAIRAERLARQKKLGIVPESTALAPRNPGVTSWQETDDDLKKSSCLLQETFAAFMEHTDNEIGRLVDYLKATDRLDNTMIMIVSDNGASSEGGSLGAVNMRSHLTYHQGTAQDILDHADKLGSEYAFNHYPMGWAQASNTPLKWYKKNAHGGGVRAPFIVHWPQGITSGGEIRNQFHHAIDVLPTVLDCASAKAPETHNGYAQLPIHGVSMRYSFEQDNGPSARKTQYFELIGNRAIWNDGWKAVAAHVKGEKYENDQWELYHLEQDYAENQNLARQHPEKLEQLTALWWEEAERFGVLPLDDRQHERAESALKRNPTTHYEYQPGMARIDRLMMPDISDRSYHVAAHLSGLNAETQGVVFSWGSRFAGFVLYAMNQRLIYEYNYTESLSYKLEAPLPAGAAVVALEFIRTGEHRGRIALIVDGIEHDALDLPRVWWTYGTTAGLTCGLAGVPLSNAYQPPFAFTANIEKVAIELEHDSGKNADDQYRVLLTEE